MTLRIGFDTVLLFHRSHNSGSHIGPLGRAQYDYRQPV
jgi:hypothetical protein